MQLFYRHFGEGKPVVILHGLFGQSDNWVTVGKRLADKFSVFIPDLRNHGQSPHASMQSYPAMVDDLLEFLDFHHLSKIILIGHSMGGKAAMTFALEHPGMLEKLVIVDISPRRYPERSVHTEVVTQMLSLDLETFSSRTEIERLMEHRIPDDRIRLFILKNLYYKMPGKLAWRLNLEAISRNMEVLFDRIAGSGQFTGSVMFIRGGNSDYILENDMDQILKLFPMAMLKTISGASHWVHADAPEELCYLLSSFLERECSYKPKFENLS